MPSRKVSIVFIICIAIIISIWLLSRSTDLSVTNANDNYVSSYVAENNEGANDEWKRIFNSVGNKVQVNTIDLTSKQVTDYDDGSLTSQISKDFASEYIRIKGSGKELTDQDIQNLVEKTLSNPKYTENTGAVYLISNINVSANNDTATIAAYKAAMNNIIRNALYMVKDDPVVVVTEALKSQNYSGLSKIDPSIVASKKAIQEMLVITVPKNSTNLHLGLINALSNILADLESMRVLSNDPVRGFSAIYSYNDHIIALTMALQSFSQYLSS